MQKNDVCTFDEYIILRGFLVQYYPLWVHAIKTKIAVCLYTIQITAVIELNKNNELMQNKNHKRNVSP